MTDKPVKVYNFQVEDFHTYFVGNCKIWVHNNDCVKKVESGEIELETKKQKGNYDEMKMDEHYDSRELFRVKTSPGTNGGVKATTSVKTIDSKGYVVK